MKTRPIVNLWFVEIGPVWFLSFEPRVLLLDHALIQLFKEWRWRAQGLPRRQFTLGPGTHRAAVIVGQGLMGTGLLLVLDHLLRAE